MAAWIGSIASGVAWIRAMRGAADIRRMLSARRAPGMRVNPQVSGRPDGGTRRGIARRVDERHGCPSRACQAKAAARPRLLWAAAGVNPPRWQVQADAKRVPSYSAGVR
ncbi:hypothetical protein GCM10028796_29250 [Ramlibacter monticola]